MLPMKEMLSLKNEVEQGKTSGVWCTDAVWLSVLLGLQGC